MKKVFKTVSIIIFTVLVSVSFLKTLHAEEAVVPATPATPAVEKVAATPAPAETAVAPATSTIDVLDLQIAKKIVAREPSEAGATFTADVGTLYCFSKVKVSDETATISHAWYYNDAKVTQVELNVKKSPGFRTYSSKTISPNQKGKWEVKVLDSAGNVLKFIAFTVE